MLTTRRESISICRRRIGRRCLEYGMRQAMPRYQCRRDGHIFSFLSFFVQPWKKKWLRRRRWRRWRLFAIRFRWRAFTLRANGILVSFIRSLLTSLEFMRENGKGRVSERARENRRCKQDICTLTRTSRPHKLAIVIIQIFAVPPMCGRYADRASRVLILINRSINMLHASCGLLYVIRRSGHWRNK